MAYNAGASSGNLILIQKQVASNSASLTFTTGITGYSNYLLVFDGVNASSNDQALTLNFSTNAGSSYDTGANYNYAGTGTSVITAVTNQSQNGQTSINLGSAFGDGTAANVGAGYCTMFNLNSSSVNKTLISCLSARSATYGLLSCYISGEYVNTTIVNAFRIQMASGNISTGTFKLYGIQN